jgi:hypothetical protein
LLLLYPQNYDPNPQNNRWLILWLTNSSTCGTRRQKEGKIPSQMTTVSLTAQMINNIITNNEDINNITNIISKNSIIVIINQKTPRTTSSTTTFMTRTKSSFSLSLPAHFKIRMLPTHVHGLHSFKSTTK